jgi:GTP cyclohydrolase I
MTHRKIIRPDVADEGQPPAGAAALDQVGMSGIEIPILWQSQTREYVLVGKANAYVSLDNRAAKGIHMSRLFLSLQTRLEQSSLSLDVVNSVLGDFLESHQALSDRAFLEIEFEYPWRRRALVSEYAGWRGYTVRIKGQRSRSQNDFQAFEVGFRVTYSSTCPCSAALARQLIQENFQQHFGDVQKVDRDAVLTWLGTPTGINATPHGQRSYADIDLRFRKPTKIDIEGWIDGVERALGTPVQTAVKREDEQEFAKLNGQNLMFAEDAARKVATYFDNLQFPNLDGYRVRTAHIESLHPHDAVAVASHNW